MNIDKRGSTGRVKEIVLYMYEDKLIQEKKYNLDKHNKTRIGTATS